MNGSKIEEERWEMTDGSQMEDEGRGERRPMGATASHSGANRFGSRAARFVCLHRG